MRWIRGGEDEDEDVVFLFSFFSVECVVRLSLIAFFFLFSCFAFIDVSCSLCIQYSFLPIYLSVRRL